MPRLARPATVRELARINGITRQAMLKRLWRVREGDVIAGKAVDWMYRAYPGARTWRVNVSRLLAAHPEFAEVEDPRQVSARLTRLEKSLSETAHRQKTLTARVRELVARQPTTTDDNPGAGST